MTPTVGRIVHYRLTAQQEGDINRRRTRFLEDNLGLRHSGLQAHVGNSVREGDTLPMTIVRVMGSVGNPVNGQVSLDGNDTLWVVGVHKGTEPGQWSWPERRA